MPELPEVESLRRSLVPFVVGRKINRVEIRLPKLVSGHGNKRTENPQLAKEFEEKLENRTVVDLKRRAKNLIFELDNGFYLLVHLKMTGQLVFRPKSGDSLRIVAGGHPIQDSENELPHKHTHLIFELEGGTLFYNDVRKFGYLLLYENWENLILAGHFQNLGLEPLEGDFSLENFRQKLQKSSGNLKKVFLEQKAVVGLGNIYADEVCFASGVLPTRSPKSLKEEEIELLWQNIVRILLKAVELGGSSVANYLLGDGSRGNYAREHEVYGRSGKPCLVCGKNLEKMDLAGRTTVFCAVCQK